jgi:hypothetical protein
MKLNINELGDNTEEIISSFISHVTRSEEEFEREREEGDRRTDLKIFLAENRGYELGTLSKRISSLAEDTSLHKNTQTFISEHNFRESVINEEASLVEIDTPEFGRTDQFVFIDDRDYLRIVTAERRKWTKRTVERLIDYLPELDRIYLSPSDLESAVEGIDGSNISGFTAKYHSYNTDKKITIRFHGGSDDELETVEGEFGARPTRLEFDQENSPPDSVQTAIAQEGFYSITGVRSGYEERGSATLNNLASALEQQDRENFSVDHAPIMNRVGAGTVREGFTTIELSEQFAGNEPTETAEELVNQILDYKNRYKFSTWEPGKYEVFDTDTNEAFEVTVEASKIRLHAKDGTTSQSFRDFAENLYESFNSTYSITKKSGNMRA